MVHFCFSYMIMKMCWNLEPTERPTFSKISQMIERLLGDQPEQEQVSLTVFPPTFLVPILWSVATNLVHQVEMLLSF